ncbi:MAG: helix-hairpin-helix domain-containing protein [Anaerolineae bacterium]|nr:helix-hairpin-helix domain-containing protein [Anaerolineae bacterium]
MEPNRISSRNLTIAFIIVAIAIVAGSALVLSSRPGAVEITIYPPVPTATSEPSATPGPVTVYVTGAVREPMQLITLPVGSRVDDALEAAGGTTENADLERVNLAQILQDGDQVHVPVEGESGLPTATPHAGPLRINYASEDELTTLPGIGPALAQRIIAYREDNGPFGDMDELDAVSGIGPALLEGLEGLITFD